MELIDTQWDVNALAVAACKFWAAELIDTQWDVNMFCLADVCKALEELIDTQWDVNTDDKAAQETPYEN